MFTSTNAHVHAPSRNDFDSQFGYSKASLDYGYFKEAQDLHGYPYHPKYATTYSNTPVNMFNISDEEDLDLFNDYRPRNHGFNSRGRMLARSALSQNPLKQSN